MLGIDLNRARKFATCIKGGIHQYLLINDLTCWKEWWFLLINGLSALPLY
jgi:hypothetical protein